MGRNDGIMYDKTDTIIDSHVHVYPDELALKTYQKLSEVGGNVEDSVIGNLKALNEMMSRLNINKVIVQHIATKPESVDDVMDFALSIKNDKILAFAPLHPFEENIEMTRRVVEYAHERGVVVEAELGRLAGVEDAVKVNT